MNASGNADGMRCMLVEDGNGDAEMVYAMQLMIVQQKLAETRVAAAVVEGYEISVTYFLSFYSFQFPAIAT